MAKIRCEVDATDGNIVVKCKSKATCVVGYRGSTLYACKRHSGAVGPIVRKLAKPGEDPK